MTLRRFHPCAAARVRGTWADEDRWDEWEPCAFCEEMSDELEPRLYIKTGVVEGVCPDCVDHSDYADVPEDEEVTPWAGK